MHPISWFKYEASPLERLMVWVAGVAVLVLGVSVVAWLAWLAQGGVADSMWPFAVILSVMLSVLTMVMTIGALTINSQYDRIQGTIEVWAHLSDELMGSTKRDLRPILGRGRVTPEQAQAMVFRQFGGFTKPNGELASQAEIDAVRERIDRICLHARRAGAVR